MRRSPQSVGDLTEDEYRLIDFVVEFAAQNAKIPRMELQAQAIGITRQGVILKQQAMARKGILYPRPRYKTNWFALTEWGEKLFQEERARRK